MRQLPLLKRRFGPKKRVSFSRVYWEKPINIIITLLIIVKEGSYYEKGLIVDFSS